MVRCAIVKSMGNLQAQPAISAFPIARLPAACASHHIQVEASGMAGSSLEAIYAQHPSVEHAAQQSIDSQIRMSVLYGEL